nr:MAG TPA: hypothetical protein [Caudoviricetes sp.]
MPDASIDFIRKERTIFFTAGFEIGMIIFIVQISTAGN